MNISLDDNIHPVLRDDYAIFTPPIDAIFNQVTVWLDNMVPGAYIYGRPRIGKTRCIRYWLSDLLKEHYNGKIVIYRMICNEYDNYTENNFLDDLVSALKGMGHSTSKSAKKPRKYDLLVNHMATEILNSETNRVIFVLDEAQNLPERAYRWLCYLQNKLDDIGIRLTFLLIGSLELRHQNTAFSKTGASQIVGRFMLHKERFRGIRSNKELAYIFAGYDTDSEWPKHSNTPFTKFFFPKAFESGFRLVDYADMFWEKYTDLCPYSDERLEVSMEHIGKAINYLFRQHNTDSSHLFEFDDDMVLESINYTQYKDYMNTVF